jgi:beta-N-acetylhexosaminidase
MAASCGSPPLLIAADNEGGQVQRLHPRLGYTAAPSHAELGSQDDLTLTELESRRIARTLKEAGINWNLAPVVDVALNPENAVIVQRGRSFSALPERVTAHARAFVLGHRAENVLTSLKHYPGHGSSRDDSHLGFVDVTETAQLDAELAPYRQLIVEGLADSVMTAHVFNSRLDSKYPSTLSAATIGKLRGELGYDGVVVSDDLHMGAIVQHYGIEEAALMALQAGVDVLLLSNNGAKYDPEVADRVHAAILKALADGRLDPGLVEASYNRVQKLKAALSR